MRVTELLESVSNETRYRRFFSGVSSFEKLARRLLHVGDPSDRLTLLVLKGELGDLEVIGMGSYVSNENDSRVAEPAFLVHDDYQGRGIGTLLLERLALMAVKNNITRFEAHMLPDNRKMKEVFEQSGFQVESSKNRGTITISFPVTPNKEMLERYEFRDLVATIASLKPFFEPVGVAVIGASRDPDTIGHRILHSLHNGEFKGGVYPVNPQADTLLDLTCYNRITDVEEPIDLAVIVVPPDAVNQVIDDCHDKDIRALVTITAGFFETGKPGRERQQKLAEKIYGYGMRMIGPNCLGLLNTDPEIRLNASFSPVFPNDGIVAMASQSGALGLAVLDYASNRNIGFSYFVSIGNKLDVSGNDLIQYWGEDDRTEVILLYLESFGNPRRFARLTKKIGLKKPILVVKGGRSESGRKAAGSHTAALTSPDIATEALFKQAGIIGMESLEETFDVAEFLANQPLPEGPGVAIVTNSGGPAILNVDALEKMGLDPMDLSETTREQLREWLPETASVNNPVDMIASAGPEEYRRTIETLHGDPKVDTIIVIFTPLELDSDESIAEAVEDGIALGRENTSRRIPVTGVFIQPEDSRSRLTLDDETIPTYRFPETAARVVGRAYQYKKWKDETKDYAPIRPNFSDIDLDRTQKICRTKADSEGTWLGLNNSVDVLESVGISLPKNRLTHSPDEAIETAESIGYPVVLKMSSRTLIHKSDWDGIRLNLNTEAEVRDAYETIENNLKDSGKKDELEGITVQPYIEGGLEVMVGMTHDEVFGPLITFGLGGVLIEILEDISVRITPLTNYDANQMLDDIKGARLLDGYRGSPPADRQSLKELLLRVSSLVEDVPEIREMDLNPVKVFPPGKGYSVLDARIKVQSMGQNLHGSHRSR